LNMKFATVALVASTTALEQSEHFPAFLDFISVYGKNYATKAEFDFRFNLFEAKVTEHKEWNATPGVTSTQGVNLFTDYTKDEMKGMLGFKPAMALASEYHIMEPLSTVGLAPVDWRNHNAVTPVKNQGSCGSCWAFSTTGSLEGAHAIKSGNLVSLSESQLMNCSSKNSGCNGGLMDLAFTYAETNPIMADSEWPYSPETIPFSCWLRYRKSKGIVTVSTYADVPKNQPDQLKASLGVGPVSVAIEADKSAFQSYTGGVLSGDACGI